MKDQFLDILKLADGFEDALESFCNEHSIPKEKSDQLIGLRAVRMQALNKPNFKEEEFEGVVAFLLK